MLRGPAKAKVLWLMVEWKHERFILNKVVHQANKFKTCQFI